MWDTVFSAKGIKSFLRNIRATVVNYSRDYYYKTESEIYVQGKFMDNKFLNV